ncbi:MAG: hypothetical protein AAGC60_16865 [Acidobacteriota bacterium]
MNDSPSTPISPSKAITTLGALALVAVSLGGSVAGADALDLRRISLELPAAPAAIVPSDLDADGLHDLAIVVVWTSWSQLGTSEEQEVEGVGLAEVLTIVPALIERRELRLYAGLADGGYEPLAAPLPLGPEVLSLGAGPAGMPLWALTDDGVAAIRVTDGVARLDPVATAAPVLAGSGTFVGDLALAHELDGDDRVDLLVPTREGLLVLRGRDLERAVDAPATPVDRVELPTVRRFAQSARQVLHYPLPTVRDVDGDNVPDLLFPDADRRWAEVTVARGLGDGRFAPLEGPLEMAESRARESGGGGTSEDGEDDEVVWLGDLDGVPGAELVRRRFLGSDDVGLRAGLRQAKRPPFRYFLYRLDDSLLPVAEPYARFDASGYAFEGGDDDAMAPSIGLVDLDGDGDRDLVSLTLDFSAFQAVRIVATQRIDLGIDFHIDCQDRGEFRSIEGLDLSGRFRVDLRDLRLRALAQLDGDFDGDGHVDFLQIGRGREVAIHRGRDGCRYPPEPDLRLTLDEAPRNLALVRVDDFDADGRDDFLVVQPQASSEASVTPSVRLDLYRSTAVAEPQPSTGASR